MIDGHRLYLGTDLSAGGPRSGGMGVGKRPPGLCGGRTFSAGQQGRRTDFCGDQSLGQRFGHKRQPHRPVWQNAPSDPYPAVIYALGLSSSGVSSMYVSFDGGVSWTEDQAILPPSIGGPTNATASANTAKVMVVSPTNPRQVYIVQDGSGDAKPATIYLFDYSQFPLTSQTSAPPQILALPSYLTQASKDNSTQDSGNVFLAVTQAGRGDLLFLGGQRATAYVGPLNSTSASDWQALDSKVHWDLHGLLLSPDFAASLQGGNYTVTAGTVWLLCDGGIRRSTDGGKTFVPTPDPTPWDH